MYQKKTVWFVGYVIPGFPLRIHTVRTGQGHEWQVKFHRHGEGGLQKEAARGTSRLPYRQSFLAFDHSACNVPAGTMSQSIKILFQVKTGNTQR